MKYCSSCGTVLADNAKFCYKCGASVAPAAAPVAAETVPPPAPAAAPEKKKTTHQRRSVDNETLKQGPMLCADGRYRWIYELNMWTNPSILFVVFKIYLGIMAVVALFILLVSLFHRAYQGHLWENFWPFLIIFGVFTVIILLAYAIVAGMYGGKYIVIFTMDEHGIDHEQIPEQAKKARTLGMLTAAAGAATGKPGMVGLGVNAAARTSMSSSFSNVRSVKPYKSRDLIKVNERFSRNQVYVDKEHFDFVYEYICSHCPRVV